MREVTGFLVIVAAACASAFIVTSCLPDVVTGATTKPEPNRQKPAKAMRCPARRWLKAVADGDAQKALELAKKIAGDVANAELKAPNAKYATIFEKDGVPASYIDAPLNTLDFKLWRYAWMLKKVLDDNDVNALKGDDAKLRKVMKLVSAKIARKEDPKGPLPWPAAVWARRYGLCDRMAWLYAEFAYQLGFETRIVYLMNSKGVSPHTICEIRSENGEAWTADPYSGILLTNVSLPKLANDEALKRKIWPKRPDWRKALKNTVCWIPAMPQDYRKVNQKLSDLLAPALGDACPRFGEDPDARLARFAKLAGKNDKCKTKMWFFPIRLIKMELEINKN